MIIVPDLSNVTRIVVFQGLLSGVDLRFMVRTKPYTADDVNRAIDAVVNMKWPVTEACKVYRVPISTLRRRLPMLRVINSETILTPHEEKQLVHLILSRSKAGHKWSKVDICKQAKEIMNKNPRPKFNRKRNPGFDWLIHFLKRNPDVTQDCLKSNYTYHSSAPNLDTM